MEVDEEESEETSKKEIRRETRDLNLWKGGWGSGGSGKDEIHVNEGITRDVQRTEICGRHATTVGLNIKVTLIESI